jgi:microcystin-dependent protein
MGVDPYIGEITIFAGNYAPQGWAFCDRRIMQITQYQALFALIGNIYGGDGRTTFALPDLRGRSVLCMGSGAGLTPRTLGQTGGYEKVGLSSTEMPTHNHTAQSAATGTMSAQLNCVAGAGTSSTPKGTFIANNSNAFAKSGTMDTMNSGAVSVTTSDLQITTDVANAGSGASHENMHPFLTLNYIIALEGVFPPRS